MKDYKEDYKLRLKDFKLDFEPAPAPCMCISFTDMHMLNFMRFCCHEEYRVLTCKTPTKTITSLRKLESLKSNSDNPLRRRMKLCEAKNLRSDSFMLLDPTSKTSHCVVFQCK
ncbi:hypothetical protein HID58_087486 [Brassica napus]|uniref:Uncharacterized protein n=1 Tax=Brassica napus TaxID=3708 RepID=A0ABQ7XTF4_BRANA|nr:hypothetical protein HID58_087486 [Brassica napus]